MGKKFAPETFEKTFIACIFIVFIILTFFLISVKMDLGNKVIGFQFEPERSISNHKGFFPGKIATLAFGASVGTAPQ